MPGLTQFIVGSSVEVSDLNEAVDKGIDTVAPTPFTYLLPVFPRVDNEPVTIYEGDKCKESEMLVRVESERTGDYLLKQV